MKPMHEIVRVKWPTAEEIRALREESGEGLQQCSRNLSRKAMLEALDNPYATTETLGEIVRKLVEKY